MYCIETVGLTHKFSENEIALDNVNLEVKTGCIYGFLGPNGAGKTTTLKLILGLLRKQRGEIFVFGEPIGKNRVEVLKKVGSLIESPSLYGHLTAVENLKLLQKIYRCPTERIPFVLGLTGLADTGRKKTAQFSLGMRQRLSIAIALLHNPSLLILDEPTNGLDPNGILEIRELLQGLARDHGITILISSHILAEIEKLVTHLGIINHGRLLFQGTLDELLGRQKLTATVLFETSDNERARRLIGRPVQVSPGEPDVLSLPIMEKEQIAAINRDLVGAGIDVYRIGAAKQDLESIFFDLISK